MTVTTTHYGYKILDCKINSASIFTRSLHPFVALSYEDQCRQVGKKKKKDSFSYLGAAKEAENTTLTYYQIIKSIKVLFEHPAVMEQHKHSFGVVFLATWRM
ncbi:hypothetical protein P7M41_25950 [Vibrio parahaemolyticus]|nr:hypothetical protein [Vibrio parahaemolyticus]